jgi:hypothetical protein
MVVGRRHRAGRHRKASRGDHRKQGQRYCRAHPRRHSNSGKQLPRIGFVQRSDNRGAQGTARRAAQNRHRETRVNHAPPGAGAELPGCCRGAASCNRRRRLLSSAEPARDPVRRRRQCRPRADTWLGTAPVDSTCSRPPAHRHAAGHSMLYDEALDRIVLSAAFGGQQFGDTWTFEGTTMPAPTPSIRNRQGRRDGASARTVPP